MPSTKFLYEFDPLNEEFYSPKTSESLALTFYPIQASDDSESPFKSISNSTIELEKKLFMFVNQVPIFLIQNKNITNIYQIFKN